MLLLLGALTGCTHISAVSAGASPGEFYAVVDRYNPLGFPSVPQGYVLRCQTRNEGNEAITVCTRVLEHQDAAALHPDTVGTVERTQRRKLRAGGG